MNITYAEQQVIDIYIAMLSAEFRKFYLLFDSPENLLPNTRHRNKVFRQWSPRKTAIQLRMLYAPDKDFYEKLATIPDPTPKTIIATMRSLL